MQETLKFNVKKENNLGVDILFNRIPTSSELEYLQDCLGGIFISEAHKESPKHFYIGLDNLLHTDNSVLYVLKELLAYGLENDLSINCNNCSKYVHYSIDKYKNNNYSVWNLTLLTKNFNCRLNDYLASKGFNKISNNLFEHNYAEQGFKHIKNILKVLNNCEYYTFQENILIYA